jgi:TRAP transporter TAXI family solute receptor
MGSIRKEKWKLWGLLAVLIFLVGGCSRGPDETELRKEVQEKLNQQFKPGLLEITSLRRQGSAPLPASESGAPRLIVYYNATIKLLKNYDFSDWEGLSPASLANVLGATEKGLSGIKPEESRQGDLIRAYGTSSYEKSGDKWVSVEVITPGVQKAAAPGNAAPPTRTEQFLAKLSSKVDLPPPGVTVEDAKVIDEELDRAIQAIEVRIDRRKHIYSMASGPEGGEYHTFAEAVAGSIAKAGRKGKFRNRETQGSVENARLIDRKEADFALIQSDAAALALAGEGPFAKGGALTSLRALGSLFPEPVQIVVSARSSIRTVSDLRGKKVDLGMPNSGTRFNALKVLGAYGLGVKDLAEVKEKGLEDAAGQLAAGRLDAFFVTIGSPTRELQKLATRNKIRLLSLGSSHIERLVTENPGLVRLVLPVNTYPGQTEEVSTVAATALLVTRSDITEAEASVALKLIYESTDYLAAGSAQGAKISKRTGLRGVTISLHPAASQYFGTALVPPAKGTPAAPSKEKGATPKS